ncbi:MAG: hypothetical protein ACTHWW_04205 [Arthrobacter sp.]|uniref:hypothetical protein n=1 Tax=unclassified Arthrobacter TaxID=235627 RepID=UPI002655CC46|nr:hypothetical protein [Micrococcaceae bacterium]MDN5812331.1 hypothetical protein [Micrococcaceae bacterium]MDN5823844.1 hypothetical protein [Micrococcaceae bacterium]MDN5878400.1 hypothetical protein [Micrococcaceae bacterium]MDN5887491.1 hypothetical protein [Micrococcaceae bacterium]
MTPTSGSIFPAHSKRSWTWLDGARFEISTGARTTSVSAVLLLGDMDALPIQEKIGLGYASWVEGSKIEPHLTQ